jgi:hypothetical protein
MYDNISEALTIVLVGAMELGESLQDLAQEAHPTCECGMWHVEEYGEICPSCRMEELK